MSIVIDTCCLSPVFDQSNDRHREFAPVLKWITVGSGRLVYGGKKYKAELSRAAKFVPVLAELSRQGRVLALPDAQVDRTASSVKRKAPDPSFNDEHLVAIVIVSQCRVVCSDDKVADRFLKLKDLYPGHVRPPKIYRSSRHVKLLR